MRSAIIILSGWRFLSAFLRKKSPLGVFSRADPELSSYPFWLKLKTLSHPIWGYLSEYFRHLLSFSDSFLKTAYVAVWTLLAGCVIQEMGTFRLFSKTATWSGGLLCLPLSPSMIDLLDSLHEFVEGVRWLVGQRQLVFGVGC